MEVPIALFGAFVVAAGSLGLVSPRALLSLAERPWRSRRGLALAALLRGALGLVLVVGADATRHPRTVTVLGVIALAAAVLIPVLGVARIRRFVDWWLARPPAFVRGWAAVAVAFGAFLLHTAL